MQPGNQRMRNNTSASRGARSPAPVAATTGTMPRTSVSGDFAHQINTDEVFDTHRVATMKRGAIVVNTARGALVDDEALIAGLKSGHIRAAGLDVYDDEPKVNPGYLTLENVTLLPHLGSATIETRDAMGHRALENLDAVLLKGTAARDRVA